MSGGDMKTDVSVESLHYQYPSGSIALRDVSFDVEEGQSLAVMGLNGSGKSTLLNHLNGLLPEKTPRTRPAVTILGRPVIKPELNWVRQNVGYIFQDPDDQLFCPTVFEDVAFGLRQRQLLETDIKQQCQKMLAELGIAHLSERAPHELSQGEKRKVCLAGVLILKPQVLVLDEPNTGLDRRGLKELIKLLNQIPATKVIASHDLGFLEATCQRGLVLAEGRLMANDTIRSTILSYDSPAR